jgi:2-C-methyl-D-erythritol 4-phosphate cytidylyltransferase
VAVAAIVVAGGSGRRFGRAKQFDLLSGRRILDWSVEAAASAASEVVVVVPAEAVAAEAEGEVVRRLAARVVAGGATRAESVRAGLEAVSDQASIVVVHDAARPLASADLFRAVIAAVEAGADGAVPGVSVPDTLKRVADGVVVATVDREELVRVQTPQAFRADVLRGAHRDEPEATDDAGLVEAAGGRVVVVPGDPRNIKLTSPDDLVVLEALAGSPSPALPETWAESAR